MSGEAQAALAALPHGPEFRFLDRLVLLEPGVSGCSTYTLRGDEPFLRGHFPGMPLLPGVLLLEAAAQLAGVVAQSDACQTPLRDLKLTAIRSAKFLGSPRPGETVTVDARIVARLGLLVQARVTATLAGQTILECEVTLAGTR